jgi:hypothetical protein
VATPLAGVEVDNQLSKKINPEAPIKLDVNEVPQA